VDAPRNIVLAEISSLLDAIEYAVEVQKELRKRNEALPKEKKMVFRIGVNLGDVIEDGNRIYGDGVNVAARIEGLADGGAVRGHRVLLLGSAVGVARKTQTTIRAKKIAKELTKKRGS
jgi:class 3 adenylate cyclase